MRPEKRPTVAAFAAAAAAMFVVAAPSADESAEGEAELAVAMSQMQYFTHKLALSVDAGNGELAGFYLHEVEELAESISADIPEYEGHAVAALMDAMLAPVLEDLEASLDGAEPEEAQAALGRVVDACNACHEATDHGFVVIEHEPGRNPYMQSFRPAR